VEVVASGLAGERRVVLSEPECASGSDASGSGLGPEKELRNEGMAMVV
jgi:hypothetical protein